MNKGLLLLIICFDKKEIFYILLYPIDTFFNFQIHQFRKIYFITSSIAWIISANVIINSIA